jgi:hypothetical protein
MPISLNNLKEIGDLKKKFAEVQLNFREARDQRLNFYQNFFLNYLKTYLNQNGFEINANNESNQLTADYGKGTVIINFKWVALDGKSKISITEDATGCNYEILITFDPLANNLNQNITPNKRDELIQTIEKYETMTEEILQSNFGYFVEEGRNKYKRFDDVRELTTFLFPPES